MSVTVGFHVSVSKSIDMANDRARELGCSAFQIFTRNPQGWRFKELDEAAVKEFKRKLRKYGFKTCLAHMPYLPNIASPERRIYRKSAESLRTELDRCAELHVPYLVTHMGSHRGRGVDAGLKHLTAACNNALADSPSTVSLLLENMAGQSNSVGSTFENIRDALDGIEDTKRIGVCFDTCHAFAAGYDLRNQPRVTETLDLLDRTIGMERIRAVHINDSKGEFRSHLDRHEHIGLGQIGEEGLQAILEDGRIRRLPLIMETPIDEKRRDADNLKAFLRLAE